MAHLRNNPASHKPWEVLPPPHCPSQTQPAKTPQEGDHPSPEPPSLPQTLDSSPSVDSLLFARIRRLLQEHAWIPRTAGRVPARLRGYVRGAESARARWERGRGFLPGPRCREKDQGTGDRHCLSTRSTGPAITRSCCLLQGAGTGARSHPGSPGKARDKFSWRPRCLCRELTE